MNYLVCFLLLTVCASISSIFACTSMPMHPESYFCRADYVTKVQVLSKKDVYLHEDGRVSDAGKLDAERSDSDKTEKVDDDLTEDDEIPSVSNEIPPEMVPPDSASYNQRSEFDFSDEEEILRVSVKVIPPVIQPEAKGLAALLSPEVNQMINDNTTKAKILMTQYSVRILKVYKGAVSNVTEYIYSPPDGGMCIMPLKMKHPYIVMGKVTGNRLHLTQSDYKIDVKQLSHAELRHLTRNMKYRYGKGCKECNITVCNEECQEMAEAEHCIWRNSRSLMDQRASQFACVRRKRGGCRWFNALNPQMTPEDLN